MEVGLPLVELSLNLSNLKIIKNFLDNFKILFKKSNKYKAEMRKLMPLIDGE